MNEKKYKTTIVDYPNADVAGRAEMEAHLHAVQQFIRRVSAKKKTVERKIPHGVILTTRPEYWDATVINQSKKSKRHERMV